MSLPHSDVEAEASIIADVLLEAAALDEVEGIVEPEDFASRAHGTVFAALRRVRGRGADPDLVSLVDELRRSGELARAGGEVAVFDYGGRIPIRSIESHARRVADLARTRRVLEAASRIVAQGRRPIADLELFVREAELEIAASATARSEATEVLSSEVARQVGAEMVNPTDPRGLMTGLTALDEILQGLKPGRLVIVAGRPGTGKSALGGHIAREASRARQTAAIYTLEMTWQEWMQRVLLAEARVDGGAVLRRNLAQQQRARLGVAIEVVERSTPIVVDDAPSLTLAQLRARARRVRARRGLGLVVVDYLQLMTGGERSRHGRREEEVAGISRGLKALAKELGVPVVALTQLNRASEARTDRRPMMSDLRESGAIEQDADAVLLLHRPGLHDEAGDLTELEVNVAKHRGGRTGAVMVRFVAAEYLFGDYSARRAS